MAHSHFSPDELGLKMRLKFQEGLRITPARSKRQGWKEAFQKAQASPLMMGEFANQFDEDEWEWLGKSRSRCEFSEETRDIFG